MYDVLDITKYIIKKCEDDGCEISNLQLQKLLYLISKENSQIISREEFENWLFGPVIPRVYYHYCGFGNRPLVNIPIAEPLEIRDAYLRIIDKIVEENRGVKPWEYDKMGRYY